MVKAAPLVLTFQKLIKCVFQKPGKWKQYGLYYNIKKRKELKSAQITY